MIIDKNAREVIYDSMEKVSSIVGKTLGPNGRNIVISSHGVYLSNDGYTVCKNIHFDNEVERIGHELLTETSELTKKMAGDGTSSTICLATEIIRRIRKYDFYKIDLNQDIINTKEIILKEIDSRKDLSINEDKLKKVLKSSMSTKDQNLINIVCKASIETGAYGLIIVRPSYEKELSIDLYEGFTYDKGMISSYLGTNGKIVLEEPYVILVNDNIKTINEFENIIYEVKKTKKDLLVIANSFSKEVVDYIIYLKKNYKYNICATLSPEFGERAGEMLEDLAIYLNTYVITNKNQYLTDKTIGVAERIEITNNETIIRRNNNKNETRKNNLEERISYLMNLPNKQEYHYKRIACLKGKIAYINVPIDNEYQYELLVQKIKNGISACKNSMISGVIEGSAKTLKDISLIKTGKEIIDDILEGLSILSHLIDQNNYYEKNMDNDNSILDSAYNTEIMISNVFELVRLFVSIDGIIINKSLNTTEKTIDDIFI